MKERIDFVSNSSSCSFVINDPVMFKNVILKWTKGCSHDLNNLSMYLICQSGDKSWFPKTWSSDGWNYDDEYRFSVSFDDFMSLSDELLSKLTSIEFMCDDFDTCNVFTLSVLKKALENNNVPVDSSNSEHPLILEDKNNYDGNKFITVLCKEAFGNGVGENA